MANQTRPKVKLKTGIGKEIRPHDPESLFRDMKSRDPQIQHLWAHQADMLRAPPWRSALHLLAVLVIGASESRLQVTRLLCFPF
jgi:hypothetical protein